MNKDIFNEKTFYDIYITCFKYGICDEKFKEFEKINKGNNSFFDYLNKEMKKVCIDKDTGLRLSQTKEEKLNHLTKIVNDNIDRYEVGDAVFKLQEIANDLNENEEISIILFSLLDSIMESSSILVNELLEIIDLSPDELLNNFETT